MSGPGHAEHCPYCQSKDFVKRGTRKKKFETVQLYLCRNSACGRAFTAQFTKGKHYPLRVIIAGLSYYDVGYGLEETCEFLHKRFGANPGTSTLNEWVNGYQHLCRYTRMRPYGLKLNKPENTIEITTMAHRQMYRFRYHRSKTQLILKEHYNHRRFEPLKDYLDGVSTETPHQYFQEGLRISEVRTKFDKAQMIVRGKQNYANELARFVLQAVDNNALRHEALQQFMIANDSVTIATEVPVYVRREDIEHMENVLSFKILDEGEIEVKGKMRVGFPRLLTGHIDVLQVRNGQIHVLDYKPKAAKERPIEQLTWYALALSRLTGLRLYEFKCAWFDENDYFEFYPLHVVYKTRAKKKKKVRFKGGTETEIPEENKLTIIPRLGNTKSAK